MILGKSDENLIITIGGTDYKLSDSSDYEKIILYLSNPMIEIEDAVTINTNNISEEDKKKLEVYKIFIEKFIDKRKEIDEQISGKEDTDGEEVTESVEGFTADSYSEELPF